jgi:hypothetical protein
MKRGQASQCLDVPVRPRPPQNPTADGHVGHSVGKAPKLLQYPDSTFPQWDLEPVLNLLAIDGAHSSNVEWEIVGPMESGLGPCLL